MLVDRPRREPFGEIRSAANHVRSRGRSEEVEHGGESDRGEVVEVPKVDGRPDQAEEHPKGGRLAERMEPGDGVGETD